jgi:hypothetical protein
LNLWERLENRVRDEFDIPDEYFAYAVDLKNYQDMAEVKMAPKNKKGTRFLVSKTQIRYVKYMDLR